MIHPDWANRAILGYAIPDPSALSASSPARTPTATRLRYAGLRPEDVAAYYAGLHNVGGASHSCGSEGGNTPTSHRSIGTNSGSGLGSNEGTQHAAPTPSTAPTPMESYSTPPLSRGCSHPSSYQREFSSPPADEAPEGAPDRRARDFVGLVRPTVGAATNHDDDNASPFHDPLPPTLPSAARGIDPRMPTQRSSTPFAPSASAVVHHHSGTTTQQPNSSSVIEGLLDTDDGLQMLAYPGRWVGGQTTRSSCSSSLHHLRTKQRRLYDGNHVAQPVQGVRRQSYSASIISSIHHSSSHSQSSDTYRADTHPQQQLEQQPENPFDGSDSNWDRREGESNREEFVPPVHEPPPHWTTAGSEVAERYSHYPSRYTHLD